MISTMRLDGRAAYLHMTKRRYIGVDLHTDNFHVCITSAHSEDISYTFPLTAEGLKEFGSQVTRKDYLAVEATGNTSFFCKEVINYVGKIHVVDPRKFLIISKSNKKTDRNDAKSLSFYLSKNILPLARLKSPTSQHLGALINTRANFVKLRIILTNRTHSLLNHHGIKIGANILSSYKSFERHVLKYDYDPITKFQIDMLAKEYKDFSQNLDELDREIEKIASTMKGYQNLLSIKGIGPYGAAVLLWVIDDIDHFNSAKKLTSYFGIAPKTRESNGTVKAKGITKAGSAIGRTTLVQLTWVAIRCNPYLKEFYKRIKERRGVKKAIIATSRKFLTIIYDTLKNDWVFEDFPNFIYRINLDRINIPLNDPRRFRPPQRKKAIFNQY